MVEFDHPVPFNAEQFKAMPDDKLVEALIDEAYAAGRVQPSQQTDIEERIMKICWLPNEEERAAIEAKASAAEKGMWEFFSKLVERNTGQEVEPEEAAKIIKRDSAARSLAVIEEAKHDIEQGISTGHSKDGSPWTAKETKYYLQEICYARERFGIVTETDFVRDTAKSALARQPGYRGIVLLDNAFSSDDESYRLGVEALQQGIQTGLGWEESHEAVDTIMRHMKTGDTGRFSTLRDLAIDLLVQMRHWRGAPGTYAADYAEAAAELAVTIRDHQ